MVLWKEIRTNPTLEKKMSKFVSLLKRDLFEKADTLLFNSLRLQKFDHIDHIYSWPWKGTKNRINLAKKDRISLYKILKPMLLETDTKLLMDLILFQLRCNEALQLFRKSKFEESKKIFNALSYTRYLYEDWLIPFRRNFRENIKDMTIQLFDIGTLYYYVGMISFSFGYFEQAIGDADESLRCREGIAHFRDESASNILLSNCYYELQQFQEAINIQLDINEIASSNNDKQLMNISYYNLGNFHTHIFEFDKALQYATKNYNICTEINNSSNIQFSLMLLAKIYQQLKNTDIAIEYYELAIDNLNEKNIFHAFTYSYILHNLILLYNKKHNFPRSVACLNKKEKIEGSEFPLRSRLLLLLSKVDIAITMYSIPENEDIEEILKLLSEPSIELNEKRSALILLLILDLQNADDVIYSRLKDSNLISLYMENTIFPPFVCYQILKEIENTNNKRKIDKYKYKLRSFLFITENKMDNSVLINFMNILQSPSSDLHQEVVIEIFTEYLQNNYVEIENYVEISS